MAKYHYIILNFLLVTQQTVSQTIAESKACNQSNYVFLQCQMNGTLAYKPWIHTFDGKYIRNITGRNYGDTLYLDFENCNYQDGGEYTCIAENLVSTSYMNRTFNVTVNNPPVVVSTDILRGSKMVFSLQCYSRSEIRPVWLLNNNTIKHKSRFYKRTEKTELVLPIYTKKVRYDGYIFELVVNSAINVGNVCVILENDVGKTMHCFAFNAEKTSRVDFCHSIIAITAVCTLVLSVIGTVVTMKLTSSTNIIHFTERPIDRDKGSIYFITSRKRRSVRAYDEIEKPESGRYEKVDQRQKTKRSKRRKNEADV